MDMLIAFFCIFAMMCIGIRLAFYNIKIARETRPERIAAIRRYKKLKNERLKRRLGLD